MQKNKEKKKARTIFLKYIDKLKAKCGTFENIDEWYVYIRELDGLLLPYSSFFPSDITQKINHITKLVDTSRDGINKACKILNGELEDIVQEYLPDIPFEDLTHTIITKKMILSILGGVAIVSSGVIYALWDVDVTNDVPAEVTIDVPAEVTIDVPADEYIPPKDIDLIPPPTISNNSWTIANILWNSIYYDDGSSGTLKLIDNDVNDPNNLDTVSVKILSQYHQISFSMPLTETGIDTGIFTGTVEFTKLFNLHIGCDVEDVIVTYVDDKLPSEYDISSILISESTIKYVDCKPIIHN